MFMGLCIANSMSINVQQGATIYSLFYLSTALHVCVTDDGWRNNPKHVEQFTDEINCV